MRCTYVSHSVTLRSKVEAIVRRTTRMNIQEHVSNQLVVPSWKVEITSTCYTHAHKGLRAWMKQHSKHRNTQTIQVTYDPVCSIRVDARSETFGVSMLYDHRKSKGCRMVNTLELHIDVSICVFWLFDLTNCIYLSAYKSWYGTTLCVVYQF